MVLWSTTTTTKSFSLLLYRQKGSRPPICLLVAKESGSATRYGSTTLKIKIIVTSSIHIKNWNFFSCFDRRPYFHHDHHSFTVTATLSLLVYHYQKLLSLISIKRAVDHPFDYLWTKKVDPITIKTIGSGSITLLPLTIEVVRLSRRPSRGGPTTLLAKWRVWLPLKVKMEVSKRVIQVIHQNWRWFGPFI